MATNNADAIRQSLSYSLVHSEDEADAVSSKRTNKKKKDRKEKKIRKKQGSSDEDEVVIKRTRRAPVEEVAAPVDDR